MRGRAIMGGALRGGARHREGRTLSRSHASHQNSRPPTISTIAVARQRNNSKRVRSLSCSAVMISPSRLATLPTYFAMRHCNTCRSIRACRLSLGWATALDALFGPKPQRWRAHLCSFACVRSSCKPPIESLKRFMREFLGTEPYQHGPVTHGEPVAPPNSLPPYVGILPQFFLCCARVVVHIEPSAIYQIVFRLHAGLNPLPMPPRRVSPYQAPGEQEGLPCDIRAHNCPVSLAAQNASATSPSSATSSKPRVSSLGPVIEAGPVIQKSRRALPRL